jgi:hypothetical protein
MANIKAYADSFAVSRRFYVGVEYRTTTKDRNTLANKRGQPAPRH